MTHYPIHTLETAPERSRAPLRDLKQTFGFIPNVAAAMATSPVLLGAFVPLFHAVHSGSFSEAEIQTVLLTNAVTNASPWPVALHSKLALDAGVSAEDVTAIRAGRTPNALSKLARGLIERRGQLDATDVKPELVLEVLTIIAASAITNYTANITNPPLEDALKPHAWKP